MQECIRPFIRQNLFQFKGHLYRIVVRIGELEVHHVGFQNFHVIRNDETVDGNLEVCFRIPRPVRVPAAWNRIFRIERCCQAESIRNILREQSEKGAAVVFISEELEDIFGFCDRIGVLCDGELMGVRRVEETDFQEIGRMMSGERGSAV